MHMFCHVKRRGRGRPPTRPGVQTHEQRRFSVCRRLYNNLNGAAPPQRICRSKTQHSTLIDRDGVDPDPFRTILFPFHCTYCYVCFERCFHCTIFHTHTPIRRSRSLLNRTLSPLIAFKKEHKALSRV